MNRLIFTSLFLLLILNVYSIENLSVSKVNPALLTNYWSAGWIAPAGESGLDYGVYHFRKTFDLEQVPEEFIINVSADNRYRLFVNGKPVCSGPARGDLMHWRFETIDISSFLKPGKNVLAAQVWNFAGKKPWAQISLQTAFILQGNSDTERIVNTNSSWKVVKNEAYLAADADSKTTDGSFIVVGPCDDVDASKYPWNWEQPGFDDSGWKAAVFLDFGRPKEAGTGIQWGLEPRSIPLMEATVQRFQKVCRTEKCTVDETFLKGDRKLVIPANTKAVVLLDQGTLTVGYPEILFSSGKGAEIQIKYAESLYDENLQKGNRNETKGKTIRGYADYFRPDGGDNRLFRPLWIRTWRYFQLTITTKDQPLVIDNLQSEFSAYPFKEKAKFESNDIELKKIWEVGWRTARLCAGETYFDCPYYEQMQYVGDTRIQALISLYVSGDDRLMRKAIQVFDDSRFSEGLTMSRYPSSMPQVIPPYSLFWIDMVYDYWMHHDDSLFVQSYLQGIDDVLQFFVSKIDPQTGLLGRTGYWNFVDWADEWPWDGQLQIGGVPKGGYYGNSSVLSLQVAYSAAHAAKIYQNFGDEIKADYYENLARSLVKSVKNSCWDNTKSYFAETPDKNSFSMHTQIFAALTGAVDKKELKSFVQRFENDTELIQPTMYFRFYLTQALKETGLADEYLETLSLWHTMLDLGLTTFAEKPDPTRSDCHAWSASPNYDFLATVAGIEPASPGFKTVKIEPHLGKLIEIKGEMPHPTGTIYFNLKRNGENGIQGEITLPEGLSGNFYWENKTIKLSGKTKIDI